jgi:hypothetical protein
LGAGLRLDSSAKPRKQLSSQVVGGGRIADIFPADIIVKNFPICRFVDLGERQIHAVTRDRAGDAADEDDRPVRFLSFHDSNMGEGIVDEPVAIVVPGIIEKDEITRSYGRSIMKFAMLADVLMDQPDSIGIGIGRPAFVQINAVLEKNRTGHARAVVGDPSPVAHNRLRSDKFGSGADYGCAASRCLGRCTTSWIGRESRLCPVSYGGRAADQGRDGDDGTDEEYARHKPTFPVRSARMTEPTIGYHAVHEVQSELLFHVLIAGDQEAGDCAQRNPIVADR